MRIAEIFQSIQGEGLLTGTESVFIRASGCNLRCTFCDTPFTSWQPEGEDLALSQILHRANSFDTSHVVLTGGEPMLFAESIPLSDALAEQQKHVTVETAGTLYLPVKCDLMSISPKLSNSTPPIARAPTWRERHDRSRHAPAVIRRLVAEYPYQVKFVVESIADCDEVERYLDEFPEIDRTRVLLMPEGTSAASLEDAARWLIPECERRKMQYCPRRHIELFGLTPGT